MKFNIYKHEITMYRKSVLTWSLSLAVIIFLFMSMFSSFAKDADVLNQALAQMPPELITAFGMDQVDMASVLGYFGFLFLFCQVCLAIQAANYGFGLVSVEERDLTADFLLAKPVKRTTILTSKLLAALTGLTITNIVVWVSSFSAIESSRAGRPYDTGILLLLLASIAIFQLVFLSLGIVISLLMKRVRSVTTLSMGLAFGMYILSAFGGMLGDDTFDLVTPFKHFDPSAIVGSGSYDLPLVLISIALIVVSITASYWLYLKRNIHSVT
ncbi:MAG: ABC transporter permease subunit [Anaerolineae bacterium]|nr:ABC transporter permease subunit [Anaerolineae bacterium]